MKFACELVVYEILPTARRELARELVLNYDKSQNEVARLFGVTGAAVCQYMKGVRGESKVIEACSFSSKFKESISDSAKMLAEGKSDITTELCKICAFAKTSGMLDEINEALGQNEPYSRCQECPNKNYIV